MNWLKAKITTTTEGIEAVCGMLYDCGVAGVQIDDDSELAVFLENNDNQWDYVDEELANRKPSPPTITFYLPTNEHLNDNLASIKGCINNLKNTDCGINFGELLFETENVSDETWLNEWKKYYKPFYVAEGIAIKPVWEQFDGKEGDIIFNIEPGHVFGTGLHQTTQLCIRELKKYVNSKSVVADLGCGSGILSIISLLLGAKEASAVDIDLEAKRIAYANAALNNIDINRYFVYEGNIISDVDLRNKVFEKPCDIIVSNIVADIIILLSPFIKPALSENGVYISSGIIKERLDDALGALKANGLDIVEVNNLDDWFSVTAR